MWRYSGFAPALDRLTVAHPRFAQLDVHVVAPAQGVGDDFQVQLALGGDNGLPQFGIHHVEEGRVFVVQGGQARGDFVFFAFDAALERGMDVGFGVFDFRQRQRLLGQRKGVAGLRVLELDHGADVPGAKRGNAGAGLAVENVDLANLLGAPAVGIVEFAAELDGTRIDAEEREFAELGFALGLEDEENGVGVGQGDFDLLAFGIGGLGRGPVQRGGTVFGDEIQEAGNADVVFRRGHEQGNEDLLLKGRVQPGPHFLVRQSALGEELLHQGVVGLGDEFDELAVQHLGPLGQGPGGGDLGELAGLVAGVSQDGIALDVEDLGEARPRVGGDGQREDTPAVVLAELGQRLLEIGFFLVEPIDHDHLGNAQFGGVLPHRVGAHADPVIGVNDHDRQVADPQRPQTLADKIGIPRAIEHIDFPALPIEVHQRRQDGDLALLFALMIVRYGGTCGNAAEPVDDARAGQHGLAEHGLAGRSMAYERNVANFARLIVFHIRSVTIGSGQLSIRADALTRGKNVVNRGHSQEENAGRVNN